jgi:hypothetical protein
MRLAPQGSTESSEESSHTSEGVEKKTCALSSALRRNWPPPLQSGRDKILGVLGHRCRMKDLEAEVPFAEARSGPGSNRGRTVPSPE